MPDIPENYSNEIEYLQSIVGKYFPIYKTEVEYDIVSFYIRIFSLNELNTDFDKLRREMVPQNYIPFLQEEGGEHIIRVKKQEKQKFRGIKTNIALLLVTLSTALIAGIFQWSMYSPDGAFFSLNNLVNGAIYFTFPLLTILSVHEMGHYFMARHHNIKASLPFFIPAPPPLGTLGAAISIREPIPDNKSLLDLGVAGPIAGFIVAIPVSIIGLWLATTSPQPIPTDIEFTVFQINFPLILIAMTRLFPWAENIAMHPTLFAGWVGFLVTGLNLLPAGQLDGGHIVRSLLGEKAKYASYIAVAFLVIVGVWKYVGWLIFAFFILFLVGLKHPPPLNDITKLTPKRKVIGVFAIIMLLICFNPIPLEEKTYRYDFTVDLEGPQYQNLTVDNPVANYTFTITNTGEPYSDEYNVSYHMSDSSWKGRLMIKNTSQDNNWTIIDDNFTKIDLDVNENRTVRLQVNFEEKATSVNNIEFSVTSLAVEKQKTVELTTRMKYDFRSNILSENIVVVDERKAEYDFEIHNNGPVDTYRIDILNISNEEWRAFFIHDDTEYQEKLELNITTNETKDFNVVLDSEKEFSPEIEFYTEFTITPSQIEYEIVRATIEIKSRGSGETHTYDLIGVVIK